MRKGGAPVGRTASWEGGQAGGKPPKLPGKVLGSSAYQIAPIALPPAVELSNLSGSSQPGMPLVAPGPQQADSNQATQHAQHEPMQDCRFGHQMPQQAQHAQLAPAQQGGFEFQTGMVGPSGPSGPSQAPAGMPSFMSEIFMPARARAAALRQQHEAQAGFLQRQQPLGVSSNIQRSVREKAATQEPARPTATAAGPQAAASSSSQMSAPAPIKAQAPANPKAKIMEEVRAAELARAIALEPKAAAAVVVDAPPSTLAFHGSRETALGQVQQDKPLTAANFKALERQLSGEKTVQNALAVEASLSFGQLPQPGAATGRKQGPVAPETIAETEESPETAAASAPQQPAMQSPFAKHRRFTPSMTADDMAAMAMGAIDRIRGRAEQSDDEMSVSSEPANVGALRSKSMPKDGSSEDLSSLALAAIARLRNLADQAKEPSPRSSSAPRPSRPSEFEPVTAARRLQLPEGPSPFKPQRSTARPASKSARPDRSAEANQAAEPRSVSSGRFQDAGEVTPVKAQHAQQATPAEAPATPALPVPAAAQQAAPPSRVSSPRATAMPDIIAAADVAAEQPRRRRSPDLSTVVASPARSLPQAPAVPEPADRFQQANQFEHAEPAVPAGRLQPAEQFESAQAAEHAEPADSFTNQAATGIIAPPTPGGSPEGSPVAPGQPESSQPQQSADEIIRQQSGEEAAPPSPSAASYTSSRGNEQDDEPFEFDEAAAAAKAKEKGKAAISTADFRPVRFPLHVLCQLLSDGAVMLVTSCVYLCQAL